MSEYTEQCALFEWAAWTEPRVPQLRWLFHIPNGEKRDKATAARLKAAGVKAGVPDIFLPVFVARDNYEEWGGLWIELKDGKGKPSEAQEAWHKALRDECYQVHVCYGWQSAARIILEYLGLEAKDYGL